MHVVLNVAQADKCTSKRTSSGTVCELAYDADPWYVRKPAIMPEYDTSRKMSRRLPNA